MLDIKKVHLYVEKINKYQGIMLLDFIYEREFLYIKYKGDVTDNKRMNINEPSMLLVHNIEFKNKKINEGDVIVLETDTKDFFKEFCSYNQDIDESATICFNINLNDDFDYSKLRYVIEDGKKFIINKESTNFCGQGALENIGATSLVCVRDVGESNCNMIFDEKNCVLFDCGASIFYSDKSLKLVKDKNDKITDGKITTLIISHWHIDHCNILKMYEDKDIKHFCCVFVPNNNVSLTSKNILKKLKRHCSCVNVVGPSKIKKHLEIVYSGMNCCLWTAENKKSLNSTGLSLCFFGENSVCFFPADHSYEQLWEMYFSGPLFKSLEVNVIVPHHGGNGGKMKTIGLNAKKAVVSVGKNNYFHPNNESLKYLLSLGFKLKRTDYDGDCIITIN